MIKKIITIIRYSTILVALSAVGLLARENAAAEAAPPDISVFWVLPFIGILLCIAIIPLINAHFWEKNLWWISLGVFCVPMSIIFTVFMGEKLRELSFEKALDYVSFIILLASLFVISGGILIKGSLSGTPKVNTIFILIGSVIASFVGTTGASMLLVRPLIRANQSRQKKAHVIIFFIFIVSNIGGSLTPLGDPPLFLGYLQGVPFEWTFRLAPQWALACIIVLTVFFIMDTYLYRKEFPGTSAGAVSGNGNTISLVKNDISAALSILDIKNLIQEKRIRMAELKNIRGLLMRALQRLEGASNGAAAGGEEKFAIDGKINLILLAGVVIIVFLQGLLVKQVSWWPRFGFQEFGMALLLGLSLVLTPYRSELRQRNGFTFGPIKEVAYLFAGIFAAMIPALYILEHKGAALGITQPWQFFWAAGGLSSFLDNAPTYLTFLSLAKGLNLSKDIILNDGGHVSTAVLTAISCGSVFMGANTYIGNGPNFMVKSIAEEQGIKMPSFFGYMIYSIAVLIPTFILITLIFFI
ncbi:MAG: sodium:proton antiporter [Spirochaetes bacterium]|nr:sodium:proton antiporter [Spirochaetota bacterium]